MCSICTSIDLFAGVEIDDETELKFNADYYPSGNQDSPSFPYLFISVFLLTFLSLFYFGNDESSCADENSAASLRALLCRLRSIVAVVDEFHSFCRSSNVESFLSSY